MENWNKLSDYPNDVLGKAVEKKLRLSENNSYFLWEKMKYHKLCYNPCDNSEVMSYIILKNDNWQNTN